MKIYAEPEMPHKVLLLLLLVAAVVVAVAVAAAAAVVVVIVVLVVVWPRAVYRVAASRGQRAEGTKPAMRTRAGRRPRAAGRGDYANGCGTSTNYGINELRIAEHPISRIKHAPG